MKSEKMEKNVVGKETKKEVKKSSRKKVTSVEVIEATEMGSHVASADASVDTSDAATATTTSTEETWFAPSNPDGWVTDQSADSMPTEEKLELRKQRRNKKIKTDAEKAAATNAARERRKTKAAQAAAAAEEQLQGFKKGGSSIAQIVVRYPIFIKGDNIWDNLAKDSSHEIAAEIPEHVLAGDMIEGPEWLPEQPNGLAVELESPESTKAEPIKIPFNPTGSLAAHMVQKKWGEMLHSHEREALRTELELRKAQAREAFEAIRNFVKPYEKIRERSMKKGKGIIPSIFNYAGFNDGVISIYESLKMMDPNPEAEKFFISAYCKKGKIKDMVALFESAPILKSGVNIGPFLETLFQVIKESLKQKKEDKIYFFSVSNSGSTIKMLSALGNVKKEASSLGKPLTPMPPSVKSYLGIETKRSEIFRWPTKFFYSNLKVIVAGKTVNLGIKGNTSGTNPLFKAIGNRLAKILRFHITENLAANFSMELSLALSGKTLNPEYLAIMWEKVARSGSFKAEAVKIISGAFDQVMERFFVPRQRRIFFADVIMSHNKLIKELDGINGLPMQQKWLLEKAGAHNIKSDDQEVERSQITVTPAQLIKIALKLKAAGLSIEQSAELLQKLNIKQVKTKEEKKPVLESLSPKSGGASETAEKVEETQIELA